MRNDSRQSRAGMVNGSRQAFAIHQNRSEGSREDGKLSVCNPMLEGTMSKTRCKTFGGVFVGLGVLMTLLAAEVWAQACEARVCRSGYTLTRLRDRPQPVCQSEPDPITRAISFYYAPDPLCPSDAALRGQSCVKRVAARGRSAPPIADTKMADA